MDSAKNQLIEKLKSANNVLVTVSRDPSVDQLAACIGLTILLNKLDKHAAAVFSGRVPSTLEFLKPEDTLEKNTDSLRDFIIALDKSKADKLRYKVEDDVVRIFITPYKTSISQEDLDFSQGDFNVDVVVALGVHQQEDLDEAITAHGRILHDATVTSININPDGGLGSINWAEPQASSLSELVTELAQGLGDDTLDGQIATALLTGIVAETARFSNQKTTSNTMSLSAKLMTAGADQQLVASKLSSTTVSSGGDRQDGPSGDDDADGDAPKAGDGTLEINHEHDAEPPQPLPEEPSQDHSGDQSSAPWAGLPPPGLPFDLPSPQLPGAADQPPQFPSITTFPSSPSAGDPSTSPFVSQPPSTGGILTANSVPEGYLNTSTDPLSLPSARTNPMYEPEPAPQAAPIAPAMAPPPAWSSQTTGPTDGQPPAGPPSQQSDMVLPEGATDAAPSPEHPEGETLAELEAAIRSPHSNPGDLNAVRDEVSKAIDNAPGGPAESPIQALNAQPLGDGLQAGAPASQPPLAPPAANPVPQGVAPTPPLIQTPEGLKMPPVIVHPNSPDATAPTVPADPMPAATPSPLVTDPNAPPPVPPPIPFNFGTTGTSPNP